MCTNARTPHHSQLDDVSSSHSHTHTHAHTVNEEAYKNAVAAFKKIAGSTKKEMSRKQFTKTLTQKYPPEFADLIFNTFDTDGNGTMSVCSTTLPTHSSFFLSCGFTNPICRPTQLSEFLVYMGLSNGGSMEQKLQGSFMLFDKDHNGQLERDEVITCFQTLLHSSLYKRYVETHDGKKPKDLALTDAQKTEITTVVGALFDALDADKVCPPLTPTPF